jgi:multidrug efflux system membrane fusion protein
VQRGQSGLYTYVVGDSNKAETRDIKIGQEGGGLSVVAQGISPGQKVVIAGQYRLQEGSLVQPTETATPAAPQEAAQDPPAKAP